MNLKTISFVNQVAIFVVTFYSSLVYIHLYMFIQWVSVLEMYLSSSVEATAV